MLRRAAASDVDAIVAFESQVTNKKLYGKPLDLAAAKSEIGSNEYYLRLDDGHVVATGALRRRDDGSIYLSNIAVHPEARRKGVARAMLRHLLSLCSAAPSLDLAVHPDNQAARALYVSLGFSPMQICENYFGDGEARLIMQLTSEEERVSRSNHLDGSIVAPQAHHLLTPPTHPAATDVACR